MEGETLLLLGLSSKGPPFLRYLCVNLNIVGKEGGKLMYLPFCPMRVKDEILVDTIKRMLFENKDATVDKLARAILYELEQTIFYEVYTRKNISRCCFGSEWPDLRGPS